MKGRINKLDFIIIKNLGSAKDTVKRMRRRATDWESCLQKHIFNKGLLYNTYKELLKLKNGKGTWVD